MRQLVDHVDRVVNRCLDNRVPRGHRAVVPIRGDHEARPRQQEPPRRPMLWPSRHHLGRLDHGRHHVRREHVVDAATQIHACQAVTRVWTVALPSGSSSREGLWAWRPLDGGPSAAEPAETVSSSFLFPQLACGRVVIRPIGSGWGRADRRCGHGRGLFGLLR
jgi:hypothetical protein